VHTLMLEHPLGVLPRFLTWRSIACWGRKGSTRGTTGTRISPTDSDGGKRSSWNVIWKGFRGVTQEPGNREWATSTARGGRAVGWRS